MSSSPNEAVLSSQGVGIDAEYRVMLGAALTVGITPIEGKEIVYHATTWAVRDWALIHKLDHAVFARGGNRRRSAGK